MLKKSVIKFIVSWAILIAEVIVIFFIRNYYFGTVSIGDAQPLITNIQMDPKGNVGIWWECHNTTITSYNIYKMKDGKLVFLASTPARVSHYWDKSVENGKAHAYAVRPINSQSNSKRTGGQLSLQSQTIIPDVSKNIIDDIEKVDVKLLSVNEKEGKVQIKWAPTTNLPFSGYLIFRREQGKEWRQIGEGSPASQQYLDGFCKAGVIYEYKVLAFSDSGGALKMSTCNEVLSYKLGGNA